MAAAIAYLLQRGRVPGKGLLDAVAMMPIALPGVVIGVGFLRVFYNVTVPGLDAPLASTWAIFVLAYMVRRLPYALRASHAALHQVHASLEDAARGAGGEFLEERVGTGKSAWLSPTGGVRGSEVEIPLETSDPSIAHPVAEGPRG